MMPRCLRLSTSHSRSPVRCSTSASAATRTLAVLDVAVSTVAEATDTNFPFMGAYGLAPFDRPDTNAAIDVVCGGAPDTLVTPVAEVAAAATDTQDAAADNL